MANQGQYYDRKTHSNFGRHFYLKDPKELFIIPGASHIDLYDKPQYVTPAVAKLIEFFGKALN